MTDQYEPELGQAIFGQPHKEYTVPDIWDAALCFLREELNRVMWNLHHEEYSSPFDNSGNSFECPTFKLEAYSWTTDDQPFNFKWRDVEISWYKYLGRGMSANQKLSPERAAEMLADCLPACRRYEDENSDKEGGRDDR